MSIVKFSGQALLAFPVFIIACNSNPRLPQSSLISDLDLKRGNVISCGDPNQEFGTANFDITGSSVIHEDFNLAIKLLHSFEYDEAEKVFAKIIDADPGCAMAYWGVAMCNFHPLWVPPTQAELEKGSGAIAVAKSLSGTLSRETAYINAIASFYTGWEHTDHRTRCLRFEKAMEEIYMKYPGDKEAAVFYALSLIAAADPSDKSFVRQEKAGKILNSLYPGQPDHPGIIHYLIHCFDYPGLAEKALNEARRYATVAPSSAHALHMPSHIFTRLGLWDESISSDSASVEAAKCYAVSAGIEGHWDEELHGQDYLVYAYLQKGENKKAMQIKAYQDTISEVYPVNFKVAYSFAAVPSRILIENKNWKEASVLQVSQKNFPWEKFPWQHAIIHFTRLLGAVHIQDKATANTALQELRSLHAKLLEKKENYNAGQVHIQVTAGEAWIKWMERKNDEALELMKKAVALEDKTEKHPVTPGEVIPAMALLADMLMEMKDYTNAAQAYEADLEKHPNRFNSLFGAAAASEKSGNTSRAIHYYTTLLSVASPGNKERSELNTARLYLKKQTGPGSL